MPRYAWIALLALACGTTEDTLKSKEDADFHYKLANGYFYEQQIVPALQELTTCLELDPANPDAHHLMGFIFFGRKEYAQSELHFRKALEIRPGFHEARANLGALLIAMKRWSEAVDVLAPLENATLYPTPWLVHNNLGLAFQHLKKRQLAERHFKQALFHNPKFCLGYNNLGALYQEMGQTDMAVDYLGRAVAKCKGYAEPYFHLGEIYEAEGRAEEARAQFGQCYKAAPEAPIGRRCRVRM